MKYLNKYFFQFLGVRITKSVVPTTGEIVGYGLMVGVLPFTGWSSDYIGPLFSFNIWNKK